MNGMAREHRAGELTHLFAGNKIRLGWRVHPALQFGIDWHLASLRPPRERGAGGARRRLERRHTKTPPRAGGGQAVSVCEMGSLSRVGKEVWGGSAPTSLATTVVVVRMPTVGATIVLVARTFFQQTRESIDESVDVIEGGTGTEARPEAIATSGKSRDKRV